MIKGSSPAAAPPVARVSHDKRVDDKERAERCAELENVVRPALLSGKEKATLKCTAIRREADFCALEPQWRDLYRRSPITTFSQSFDWCLAAWREIARPRGLELYIVVGEQAGRLSLVLPLVVGRKGFVRVLYPLGSLTSDYFDAIVEKHPRAADWVRDAWDHVRREGQADLADLWFVRTDSVLAGVFGSQGKAWISSMPTAFLDLTKWEDVEAYRSSRSTKLRQNLRRYRRLLAKEGSFEYRVAQTEEEVDEITDWIVKHKASDLKKRGVGETWFGQADYRRFLKEMSLTAYRAGKLYVSFLTLDGATIAAQNAFLEGGILEGRTISYDPRWSRFSPGSILFDEAIAEAFDLGMNIFDFRIGAENYKSKWNNESSHVARYRIPLRSAGILFLKLQDTRRTWRHLSINTAARFFSFMRLSQSQ